MAGDRAWFAGLGGTPRPFQLILAGSAVVKAAGLSAVGFDVGVKGARP